MTRGHAGTPLVTFCLSSGLGRDAARTLAPVTHLLYLHGFRSSPQSTKARQVAAWVANHHPALVWWCPQLDASPRRAMEAVFAGIAAWSASGTGVIGSSLGGYYAAAVAERLGCRVVLLNPAVDPARDLTAAVGRQVTAWHSAEPFDFRPEYVDELRALAPPAPSRRERYFTVIAEGDEVLAWQEMSARYAGCPQRLLPLGAPGSDHALSDFAALLPETMAFFGLAPAA